MSMGHVLWMGEAMRLSVAAIVFAAIAVPSLATAAPKPACAKPQYRQLDFWVGNWDLAWKGGTGTNRITRSYDGCVIEEHFDGAPSMHLKGHSVSLWFAPTKDWRQTWVDNQGEYFNLRGGPDGKGNFVLNNVRETNKARHLRMVFTDIKPDSLTWRWQSSKDGKAWADRWVIHYTRKTP
jgi:hypothetical protein